MQATRWLKNWTTWRRAAPAPSGEQPAAYYDQAFQTNPDWQAHYTASPYYHAWTVILDRVRRAGARSVLEIGCGPGQLAQALHEAGLVDRYCGLDFSAVAIAYARRAVPTGRFEIADALTTDLYVTTAYDVVITTEFLEHVTDDLAVMRQLRAGARVIGTVPNFPYVSHVRHFADAAEVVARYQPLLGALTVDPIRFNASGSVLFLLEGTRT
jgi:SAM-dependent methyltransferase